MEPAFCMGRFWGRIVKEITENSALKGKNNSQ